MKLLLTVAMTWLVWSCQTPLLAQNTLELSHDSSWQISGRQVNIHLATLVNSGAEDSPPLFLSIYAQRGAAYEGGRPGRLLARAPLGVVPAGSALNNVLVSARYRGAGPGLKFTALMVETKNGRRYAIADYVTYTSLYSFPPGQSGGVGSDDLAIGDGDILVSGDVNFAVTGRRAAFAIARIQNQREPNLTGLLRIAFYATPEPYTGGVPAAAPLAARVLGALAPGDFYRDLAGTILLRRPRRGTYYLTMTVEEDREAGFVPVAHVTSSEPRNF